ncbi:MAG: hemolysin family protein [Pseudomonadota bacterium]
MPAAIATRMLETLASLAGARRGDAMLSDLLIVLILILVNGLFSGAEIAILTVRKTRLNELVEQGHSGAQAVKTLRDRPERFLATVQIGVTVVGASSAAYGGGFITGRLASILTQIGIGPQYAGEVAFAVVVASISYLSLVLGELVPKSLALRHADKYATSIGKPLLWLSSAIRPLVWLLTTSSNAVLRLFGDKTSFTEARLSREELQELVEEAAKTGSIDPRSSEIASRAIGFGEVTVEELMVPRSEMVALPRRAPADEVKRVLLEEGHSRMPVFDESLDNIVGYVIAKNILALAWEQPLVALDDILRPVFFVPETARAVDVLRELQQRKMQLAIVIDEHGSVAGLVTAEDLVEELVGEILSEHEPDQIRREPDGTALVQGTVPIREVNRELDLELPEGEDWTTIAGLVLTLTGVVPQQGKRITIQDGTILEVVEATSQQVVRVRVRPVSQPPQPGED